MTVVTVNGNTYSDDGSTPKDMNDGGSADYFFPMVQDTMVEIDEAVTNTAAAATAAAASAISAVNSPGTNSTSASSISVSVASKSFTTQPGKLWAIGSFVVIARTSAPTTTWLYGQITAYNSGTGAMTVNVTRILGGSSATDWTISLSSPSGRDTGGATTGSHLVVDPTSPKYLEAYTDSASGTSSVVVGTNSGPVQGPGTFGARNATSPFGIDVLVKDAGTSFSGFLPPGKTARIDASTSGLWKCGDLRSTGSDLKTQMTFSSVVAGTAGVWTKAIVLPISGNTLVLVHGASIHAVIYNEVLGWGTPLLVRSGLSTAGAEGTVMAVALNDGTDNVIVASCPENGTALQSIIVASSGLVLTLGTLATATLGTAAVRLLDFRKVPNSLGNISLILSALGSTTTLQNYGIVVVPTATSMTIGAVRTDTTTASFGALLLLNLVNDVYVALVSTATVLTAKAVTINPTTGAQTLGSTATTTVTSASNILVREIPSDGAAVVFLNTLPKVAKLTLSTTVPSFSAASALTATITTSNTYGVSASGSQGYTSTAVSGTDSSGRFLTEIMEWDFATGPTLHNTIAVTMSAAHTVVWVGDNLFLHHMWQLLSATELVLANSAFGITYPPGVPNVQRLSGLGVYAQVLLAPEANYPRYARPRTTMSGAQHVVGVTDGTKCSVDYSIDYSSADATPTPVNFVNSLTFSHLTDDQGIGYSPGVAWLASGPAPSLTLVLQRGRVA